jgi:hypothetical protein
MKERFMGSFYSLFDKDYVAQIADVPPLDEDAWVAQIDVVEAAVNVLLDSKRAALTTNPVREQVLWTRHVNRLRTIKRKFDAVCL